ncbi:hypothetical protein [Azohydromonas caseinilytica]|uniref:Uncharacterized protein n=1 Tax=Azohydromonas caseinilytica TaxID=2728836 RepID=A0A848FFA3_9BURK|nr:hypothetical protein [Azohydromonas caseinilytica]NML16830.1 hypothetical protein [Azohydromonas caseinilytica]
MADKLRTGTVNDLEDSLAGAIEAAMQAEWHAAKGQFLPDGAAGQDRRILFVAIAKGVLGYLEAHQAELLTTVEKDTLEGHAHQLSFGVDRGGS